MNQVQPTLDIIQHFLQLDHVETFKTIYTKKEAHVLKKIMKVLVANQNFGSIYANRKKWSFICDSLGKN